MPLRCRSLPPPGGPNFDVPKGGQRPRRSGDRTVVARKCPNNCYRQNSINRRRDCGATCTAGLIAAAHSQAESSSDVLHGGLVTYTKAKKIEALEADEALSECEGNVTSEAVRQLPCGAVSRFPVVHALVVSGALGLSPDDNGTPVGLAFPVRYVRGRNLQIERKNYSERSAEELRRTVVLDSPTLLKRRAKEIRRAV